MPDRDMVVIGGSAGGHAPLRRVLERLPAGLPAALLVVMHMAPGARSSLADMLVKDCPLPVMPAVDGMAIERGHVYVAVPDRHLLVASGDLMRLSSGPRENRARPAVDALFRSAARWCGPRTIGVVLSGSLDDGAAGLASIAQHGGVALVQDPHEARFPGMPSAALAAVPAARTGTAENLAELIAAYTREAVTVSQTPDEALIWESDVAREGRSSAPHPGRPVALGCPDCGGGLREIRTGRAVHFVCHVGHSWSPQSFIAASDEGIEQALWTAVSALQEKATMLTELAGRADDAGQAAAAATHRSEAAEVLRSADLIRGQLDHARRTRPGA